MGDLRRNRITAAFKTFRDGNTRKRVEHDGETRHLLPVTLPWTALTYAERRHERRRRRLCASSSGSWARIDTMSASLFWTNIKSTADAAAWPGSGPLPRSNHGCTSLWWRWKKMFGILNRCKFWQSWSLGHWDGCRSLLIEIAVMK